MDYSFMYVLNYYSIYYLIFFFLMILHGETDFKIISNIIHYNYGRINNAINLV